MMIPLSRPEINQTDIQAVTDVLRTPFLSIGPRIGEFETMFSRYVGGKFAVGVNSGTSALHLIIRSLGIGPGEEVITTPFSFVASANCVLYEGARPVFVDIEEETLNIDPERIKGAIGERTRAILPVDVFGHPCEWDTILKMALEHGLSVIEDSCEALGSGYKGRKCGSFGVAAAFGFYPNKQITTGEGGMVVTDDPYIAELCRSMRNQGRGEDLSWLDHERLGYNYRLDEMSAALGISQLQRIEEIIEKRAKVAEEYSRRLQEIDEIITPQVRPEMKMSWFVYVVRLKNHIDRDGVIEYLKGKDIASKPYFPPIHLQPFYREKFGFREGDFLKRFKKKCKRCCALSF
ncbi:MAG: DegT/DnrJ/EryC1/StrS family aminotransferase [Candidatus Atribacteria bacterium]|nr:DegT/DnrJ/EryC1/StrS family aminotransferase [Candidatus Atribacteria bacterium]